MMIEKLFSLKGKIALVTGASSGLGYHFARVLAAAGAVVVVSARREAKLEKLVKEITSAGGQAIARVMDVRDSDGVMSCFERLEGDVGVIDVLVNNAGISEPEYFLDVDEESWDRVMETNLKGAWRVARACAQQLIAAGKPGSIINIASLLGLATQSMQSTYCISKAGVVHMTRALAAELMRYHIRINAIAPGYFLTEINRDFFASQKGRDYIKTIPARRLGEADELSGPLLLLASEAGSFLNGVVLPVDGGHLVAGR